MAIEWPISSPVATGGAFEGLASPDKAPTPQIETWNTIFSWVFVNFSMSSPPGKTQSPPIENFLATAYKYFRFCSMQIYFISLVAFS